MHAVVLARLLRCCGDGRGAWDATVGCKPPSPFYALCDNIACFSAEHRAMHIPLPGVPPVHPTDQEAVRGLHVRVTHTGAWAHGWPKAACAAVRHARRGGLHILLTTVGSSKPAFVQHPWAPWHTPARLSHLLSPSLVVLARPSHTCVSPLCVQSQPAFDAKGIETVRRDSCPAVAKMLEHSIRLLFGSKDLSQVGTRGTGR